MVWDHISITKPHLVYISLGSFATLFLLASSIIKEQLYLGEAIVATAFGVIFGPHATSLIDPRSWGSSDITTIEFARVVLVIQCFALGVELPGFYVFRHWRSLLLLLVPVMCFGWAVIGVAVWWMVPQLGWMESLIVAACLTPTDPILASSIVGNGRFAQRVPRHLRDLLSAESGCNDCMGLVFMYLALYILKYDNNPREFALKFFVYVVLYECIAGAIVGFVIGYVSRRGIKYAEQRGFIDRESFLVFYVFIALLCSGAGSVLGMDDLLVGFFAGIAFSNDGWFKEKTEESHITNIVDLMLNITFFVYFGTVIPWEQFGDGFAGLHAWRLVVAAVIIFLFRRIPAVVALKAWIPDVRTWREALFVGHFGPIGVGAIFIAMLARGQLEHGRRVPLPELPSPDDTKYYDVIRLIWPITAFMVVASALVHGSSVALFVLGKHIQTLNLTITYDFGSPSPTPPKISRPVPQRVDALQEPHTSAVDFQDPFARLREVQDSPDPSEVAADGTSERGPDLEPPSPGGGLLTPRMALDSYGWRRTPSRRSQEAMRNTGSKGMSENVTSRNADEAGLRGRGRPGRAYKYGSTVSNHTLHLTSHIPHPTLRGLKEGN